MAQSIKSGNLAIPTFFASLPASYTMSSTNCILRAVHALWQYPWSSKISNGALIRCYHLCPLLGLIAAQIAQVNKRFCWLARPTASFVGKSYFSPKYPCSIVVIIFTCKKLASLAESAFCGAFGQDLRSAVLHAEYFSLVVAGHPSCLVSSLSSFARTWAMPASSLSSSNLRKGYN